MNILVTGANGFIGQKVIQTCKDAGFNVYGTVRPTTNRKNFNFIALAENPTCEDWKKILEEKNIDIAVHSAGRVYPENNSFAEFEKSNKDLTLNFAKSCLQKNIKKFIFLSSLSVYGRFPKGVINLEQPVLPDDNYGKSKWAAEKELNRIFSTQSQTQIIILRLPTVYGPGVHGNLVAFMKMASKGIPLPLGATKGKRSLIFTGNVCDAILRIIKDAKLPRPSVQTYLVNDGKSLTSKELYSLLCKDFDRQPALIYFPESLLRILARTMEKVGKVFGFESPINNEAVSRLFNECQFNTDKFCHDYCWSPPFQTEEGLKSMVEWYKNEK
jgi:nucleoside-diphosphate-sugar epimerase